MSKEIRECIDKLRKDTKNAAEFFAQKIAYTLGPVELKDKIAKDEVKVIDVRADEDYKEGHIETAISIPKMELKDRMGELSKDELYVIYCYNQQCHLGAVAALMLAKEGYHVMELDGGFDTWVNDFEFESVID